ncbi:bag domain containing protein [Niveomyces insectorum RCEF 264]|uniref:Bag domain containing protein n=1 Tax=Niveomyces insectorum RCEF 264 TaxID=1081102 RepID=A0A167PDF4_9HYPO|nr:bag domain containing protein [Niveomyces insectorum RCEF 264]
MPHHHIIYLALFPAAQTEPPAKVASGPVAVASSGVPFAHLANITSVLLPKLPAALQAYLDTSVDCVATALAHSSSYIQSTTGFPPTALYSTVAGALVLGAVRTVVARKGAPAGKGSNSKNSNAASTNTTTASNGNTLSKAAKKNNKRKAAKKAKNQGDPATATATATTTTTASTTDNNNNNKTRTGMRRYGWSLGGQQLSPFTSTLSQDGVPNVTDDDFEYITSEDLNNNRTYEPQSPVTDHSATGSSYFRPPNEVDDDLNDIPQDDVLLFRHGHRIAKEFFPAYVIGDGKLLVDDVRDRVQLIYKLSDAQTQRAKLYYKGKLLKDGAQPLCVSGVKNNSEILVTFPAEGDVASPSSGDLAGGSSASDGYPHPPSQHQPAPKKGNKGRRGDRSPPQPAASSSSPSGGLEVPGRGRSDQKKGSSSRAPSAASGVSGMSGASGVSGLSAISMPPALPGSPMEKLNNIALHFHTKLQPLCDKFVAQTPTDAKKRGDDHRRISETVMQQVILKLDEVDTGGDDAVRSRRKELVNQVQDALKEMDAKLKQSR